jgi:hypothetical protein
MKRETEWIVVILLLGFFLWLLFRLNNSDFNQVIPELEMAVITAAGSIFLVLFSSILFNAVYGNRYEKTVTWLQTLFLPPDSEDTVFPGIISKFVGTCLWYWVAFIPFYALIAANFITYPKEISILIPGVFLAIIFTFRYWKNEGNEEMVSDIRSIIISTAIIGVVLSFGHKGDDIALASPTLIGLIIFLIALADSFLFRKRSKKTQ